MGGLLFTEVEGLYLDFKFKYVNDVGLPWWLRGEELPANAGDVGLIPGLGRCIGEGNGNPLWYSCLGSPMGRGVWWTTVHRLVSVQHDLVTRQQHNFT